MKLKGKNSKTGYFHTFQVLVVNGVVCQFAIILKLKVRIKSNTNSQAGNSKVNVICTSVPIKFLSDESVLPPFTDDRKR